MCVKICSSNKMVITLDPPSDVTIIINIMQKCCRVLTNLKEVYEVGMVEPPHACDFLRQKLAGTFTQTGLVNHLHRHTLCKKKQEVW